MPSDLIRKSPPRFQVFVCTCTDLSSSLVDQIRARARDLSLFWRACHAVLDFSPGKKYFCGSDKLYFDDILPQLYAYNSQVTSFR